MDGILLFNKPILWTSHDAVDFVRRRLGQRSVGHAGTLDPMATGLLVMLIGKATKLSQGLSASNKTYSGTMTLGLSTETQDLEGRVVSETSCENIEEAAISNVFSKLIGTQQQKPPLYSATKMKGKKLYQWARQGAVMDIQPKEIHISDFKLLHFQRPELYFSLECSKGTYVRSICDQVGKELGCGAALSSLVRNRSGVFHLTQAVTDREFLNLSHSEIERRLLWQDHENLSRHSG